MGRKKIQIKKLESSKDRTITYNKRKKGLLKKACELAVLCNLDMLLAYRDVYGNLILFSSSDEFDLKINPSKYKKIINFQPTQYPRFFSEDGGLLEECDKLGDNSSLHDIKGMVPMKSELDDIETNYIKHSKLRFNNLSIDIPNSKLRAKPPQKKKTFTDFDVNDMNEKDELALFDEKCIELCEIDENDIFHLNKNNAAELDECIIDLQLVSNEITFEKIAADTSLINGVLNNLSYFLEKNTSLGHHQITQAVILKNFLERVMYLFYRDKINEIDKRILKLVSLGELQDSISKINILKGSPNEVECQIDSTNKLIIDTIFLNQIPYQEVLKVIFDQIKNEFHNKVSLISNNQVRIKVYQEFVYTKWQETELGLLRILTLRMIKIQKQQSELLQSNIKNEGEEEEEDEEVFDDSIDKDLNVKLEGTPLLTKRNKKNKMKKNEYSYDEEKSLRARKNSSFYSRDNTPGTTPKQVSNHLRKRIESFEDNSFNYELSSDEGSNSSDKLTNSSQKKNMWKSNKWCQVF